MIKAIVQKMYKLVIRDTHIHWKVFSYLLQILAHEMRQHKMPDTSMLEVFCYKKIRKSKKTWVNCS